MNTHTKKTQENKSNSVANLVSSNKGGDAKSVFQFVDNRPEATQMRKFQEFANNHSRKQIEDNRTDVKQLTLNSNVVQLEWGDDHTPTEILLLLTGKNVGDFENHRGEAFSVISISQSPSGGAIVLSNPDSTTHLTIPYTKNVEKRKYEERETPHMTGLFNSGTEENPEMTEWSQEYDLSGKAIKNAEARNRDDQKYVRRNSLDEGEFLMASKVNATGGRRANAQGVGGERFIRRPSIEALNLDEAHLPLSAEEQEAESRYQAYADELGEFRG